MCRLTSTLAHYQFRLSGLHDAARRNEVVDQPQEPLLRWTEIERAGMSQVDAVRLKTR